MRERADDELARRVREGQVAVGTFLNLGSAVSAEICGGAGFDWVLVDLEHGSGTERDLIAQLHALSGTVASGLVRVESHEQVRIGRALDAGAAGIMVPRVDTAEQAELIVRCTRYPPIGVRGVSLMTRAGGFAAPGAEMAVEAGGQVLSVVQIETARAVDAAGEIAEVRGVDVLFLGPADMSSSLGVFGRFDDPMFVAALRAVYAQAARYGKVAGVLAGSVDEAERYLEEGYTFIGLGGDGGFLARSARSGVAELRSRIHGDRDRTGRRSGVALQPEVDR